jgi:hypothetical protein
MFLCSVNYIVGRYKFLGNKNYIILLRERDNQRFNVILFSKLKASIQCTKIKEQYNKRN